MGNCNLIEEGKIIQIDARSKLKEIKSQKKNYEELDDKFKDMPEWEGNKYVGEGIRKMKAYICHLKIDELQKLREEFWLNKIQKHSIYKVIRQACMMDEVRANNLLSANFLTPVNGCLNQIMDNYKKCYLIPNFCINDPYFEKNIISNNINDENINKQIEIFMYDLYDNKKYKVKISNISSGSDLKSLFFQISEINSEDFKIKFIFGGTIIKDEDLIYQHSIKNEYTVQILKLKIN